MYVRKSICLSMAAMVLLCIFAIPAAAVVTKDSSEVVTPLNVPVCFDEYSGWTWFTIDDAKDYYGHEFEYIPCSHWHNNSYYNYFYIMESGSKVYLYVIYDDDDGLDPFVHSGHESEMG